MSKSGFSKTDNRRAVMALAVVAMFLATVVGLGNVEAASPVSLSTEETVFDIMEDGPVVVIISITSSDTNYKKMNVYLDISYPAGVEWEYQLLDVENDEVPNRVVQLGQGGSTTVKLKVFCYSPCASGQQNKIDITGRSDPKYYNGGLSDPDPSVTAQTSSNTTNTIQITLNARTGYSHDVDCVDGMSSIEVYQGVPYSWKYTLTNTGWDTDSYQFTSSINSESGADTSGWSISPGLVNGKELTGADTSLTGVSEAVSSIQFTPALTARPGTYNIEMIVSSNNGGAPDNCEFDVIVPQPDLEIKNTDVDFSHTSAWINTRGDTQKVTIYATVRNNGGNIDSTGVNTNEITVKFYADSAPIGTSQTISLKHGEETKLSVDWNPGRAHTSDEVGLVVTVKIDPSSDIEESDETNNEASKFFKVVRTKSSTPSFFMGFFALIGSVAVAVMLSSYYRNKDLEE